MKTKYLGGSGDFVRSLLFAKHPKRERNLIEKVKKDETKFNLNKMKNK